VEWLVSFDGVCVSRSNPHDEVVGRTATLATALLILLSAGSAVAGARSAYAVPCRLSHFFVAFGPYVSEETGQHTLALRLINGGGRSCVFDGYPQMTLYDERGVIPFEIRHGGDQMISSRPPRPVLIQPHHAALVLLNKYRCDRGMVAGTRSTTRIRIGQTHTTGAQVVWLNVKSPSKIPEPWRIPDYCGKGDPGSIITVSPFVTTIRAATLGR
jgi:hypothetical protein